MTAELGTYLRVWDTLGGMYFAASGMENSLDAHVGNFLETSRDSLVHIELAEGGLLVIRASQISSWSISTIELRKSWIALDVALEQEAVDSAPWDGEREGE